MAGRPEPSAWIPPAALAAHPAWRLGNVLDVRPPADFAAAHPAGAWNLPWRPGGWEGRGFPAFLLPPRHEPLLVVAGEPAAAAAAVAFLRERGRWRVDACLLAEAAALPPAAVETGAGQPGLWKPPEFLSAHAGLLPPPAAGPALDLGCGCGRAAVWLARRGYRVTGVDILPDALELGRRLARASGLPPEGPGTLAFLERDLRDPGQAPAGPWAVALALRYLNRPLLACLADLMTPGGVLVLRTFRTAAGVDAPPPGGHRLRTGELRRLLPESAFETLVLREDDDPDGRPAAGLVARRRAD